MKCKRVGKRDANTDNTLMCYRRGNRRTRPVALQAVINPLDNQLGYMGKQAIVQS